MVSRILILSKQNSYIILGPRQSGKSTLIKLLCPSAVWSVNLLIHKIRRKYLKDPSLFRKEALYQIEKQKVNLIVVDEVQKVPELLDEVHALIEETSCKFWMSGSSARKLKQGSVNLLAGRALIQHFFPFVYREVKSDFDLETVLQFGLLGGVFFKEGRLKRQILHSYADTYLREEIQAEGLVRQLGGFSRFLDVAAQTVAEPVNYSALGRDADLISKTVQNYFDILEDTLVGFRLPVWRESVRKQLAEHPKFYFFDNGVTCALLSRLTDPLDAPLRGRLMEQWIAHELRAAISYAGGEEKLFTWRTIDGASEVDFLVVRGKKILAAIEVKSFDPSEPKHFYGLRVFGEEQPDVPLFLVCTASHPRMQDRVQVTPWQFFLERDLPQILIS